MTLEVRMYNEKGRKGEVGRGTKTTELSLSTRKMSEVGRAGKESVTKKLYVAYRLS